MKIFSWNVNGIRAVLKKGLFQPFLDEYRPDIVCLQETKAERGQFEIDLADYREYWNSAVKKGYSGTAIFSKQEPLSVVNGFPHEFARRFTFADELERDSAEEGRVITAEFKKFYVVTVYTPNAKDDLSRLPLRFKHWIPPSSPIASSSKRASRSFFAATSMSRTPSSTWPTPSPIAARRASRTRSARDSRISWMPVSWIPSGCSLRATGITRGGAISPIPGRATWGGESTTFSFRGSCATR